MYQTITRKMEPSRTGVILGGSDTDAGRRRGQHTRSVPCFVEPPDSGASRPEEWSVRQFSADYLDRTRRGMWADSRTALGDLSLSDQERVLDVGCGTGELTTVLVEETDATVVGVDADTGLLTAARDRLDGDERDDGDGQSDGDERDDGDEQSDEDGQADRDERQESPPTHPDLAAGDATRLPFPTNSFDLVVCQALLVNPLREFARVSRELVAAVEPDNADVAVSSTVDSETRLEREARTAFIDGVATDVTTRALSEAFADAGLSRVRTRRYHHEKRVEPPYSEADLEGATRKATGAALAGHETELRRALSEDSYDDLRQRWRAMGRAVVDQMRAETYERVEVVPFDVAVGRV